MRFAERHAWQFFLAMGVLGIWFGVTDLSSAVTFVSRQLATTRPGGPEVASIVYSAVVAILAALALGLSYRRYLIHAD